MKTYHIFFILLVLVISSCTSGRKAYKKGDYFESVIKATERLRKNSDHKKSRNVLKSSYPQALKYYKQDAENELASNSRFKWRNALDSYSKINRMYEEIRTSPGALSVIPNPSEYYQKIAEIKLNAAEESYKAGLDALAQNNRASAKTAYFHFMDADALAPGYKNVKDLIEESLMAATLKVVVDQIPVPTIYKLSTDFFQENIEAYLHQNGISGPFVRFFNMSEAADLNNADHYIRIQFDDFVIGETHTLEKEKTLKKDSVKVGEVTASDGSKIPTYNTVSAKLFTYTQQIKSRGQLSVRIVDAISASVIKHDKFQSEFIWENSWANFNGDERALESSHKELLKNKRVSPPMPQDLFYGFSRPLYNDITRTLTNYYRRF